MFFFLTFKTNSANNYPIFKIDDAKVCPTNVTNSVTDLNSELSETTQIQVTVYLGRSGLTVRQSEIDSKQVTFIGCSNEITLNVLADQQINSLLAQNIKLNYQNTENAIYQSLAVANTEITSNNPFELKSTNLTTDLYSAKSSGVSAFSTDYLIFSDSTNFSSISFSNSNVQFSDSASSSKQISFNELAEIEFTTVGQIELTAQSLSKQVLLIPRSNGTRIYFSNYDSSINMITINNDEISDLTLISQDTTNLNVKFTDESKQVTKEEYLPAGDDSLNAGQIIGIIIAVILCVVAVLACVFITKCEAKEAAESEMPLRGAETKDEDEHSL